MVIDLKQKILFNIVNILGNHKNFKLYKNNYRTQLIFSKIYNSILILRIKNLFFLSKWKTFNLFFFNYIKEYHLGIKQHFKSFNSLKNNFKLFFYLLYKSSLVSLNSSKNTNIIKGFIQFNNIFSSSNNYYPYSYYNSNLTNSFFYNFLYKDTFKLLSFSLINKFKNYTYLRSNKKKRFKQKESEKLSVLRNNLNLVEDNPFRLKFYYRYFEYKRLHSYWNKEAFLKKKFKYFNPSISNPSSIESNNNKDLYLLHFFYKYRKFRKLTDKYLIFKKKRFINFWLQAKIKRYQLSSYKSRLKNKKTQLKFYKVYFKNIDTISENTFNFKKSSLSLQYKKYLFNIKNKKKKLFLEFCYNSNLYIKTNINNINSLLSYKFKKNYLNNFLSHYKNIKKDNLNNNFHLYDSFKRIKNFKRFNLPPTVFWKKKRGGQLFNLNTNNLTKSFFFNYFKKNKSFRIKFKYIKWLNTQKIFKSWKFKKYLSYKKIYRKNIKRDLNNINFDKFSSIKKNNLGYYDIIFNSSNKINYWFNYNKDISYIKNSKTFNSIVNSLESSTNRYIKNFSFYKSNKTLNVEYSYWNIFKEKKFDLNKIKIKKKKKYFSLNKLSKALFKRSWFIIKHKNKKTKKLRGFYNLVPIYNYFFIKKVIMLYKKLFISKLLFSDLLFKRSLNIKNFFSSNSYIMSGNLNILNSIHNIRSIDKKFGFKKRKERNLFNQLKKYKNIKTILIGKLTKVNSFLLLTKNSNTKSNNFDILQYKIKFNLLNIKKIINKLKVSLKKLSTTNLKKNKLPNASFKIANFKKISFINFLQHFSTNKQKKNVLNFFLDSISLNSNKNILSYIGFNSFYLNKKNININKLRLDKFKRSFNLKNFSINFKKNKSLLNSLVLKKLKKNNFLKSNWGLNSLLQKNYFTFLKLFKYFSFYKVNNNNNHFLGFGKLSNYLNIHNENIFSLCNFFMYNFLNYITWEKENSFYRNNDYVGINNQNTNIIYHLKSNYFNLDKNQNDSLLGNIDNNYTFSYNYDIINKKSWLFNNILNSKHFIIKYNSLLSFNPLISIYNKGLLKNKNIIDNKYNILKLNNSDIIILNWYLLIDCFEGLEKNNHSFKKLYLDLLNKFKNI